MNNLKNSDISFNARIFWNSVKSYNFAKDFPELKNVLKHHMGGDNITHYVQYDKDIFILSSSKEISSSNTNSYSTGVVGCSKDDIKQIFREHFNKFKTFNNSN